MYAISEETSEAGCSMLLSCYYCPVILDGHPFSSSYLEEEGETRNCRFHVSIASLEVAAIGFQGKESKAKRIQSKLDEKNDSKKMVLFFLCIFIVSCTSF